MPHCCAVLSCGSTALRDYVSFFRIPSIYGYGKKFDPQKQRRRDAWIAAIRRSNQSETKFRSPYVCSRHFIRGRPAKLQNEQHPDWIPTQNMDYENSDQIDGSENHMEADTNDSEHGDVVTDHTVWLRASLTRIEWQLQDNIDIKQEVDDEGFSANNPDDSTNNFVIKEEMCDDQMDIQQEVCDDYQTDLKQEEIDIKNEASSWSTESCDEINVEYENSNECGLADEQSNTVNGNFSEVVKLVPGYQKAYASTVPFVTMEMIHDFYINIYLAVYLKGGENCGKASGNYGDEAIEYVQLSRQNGTVTLKCKVRPAKTKSYNATIVINERDSKIESCECMECSAAKVGCKHAIALLYWLHRRTEGPPAEADECYWVDPIPIKGNKRFVTCKDFGEVPALNNVNRSNFLELFLQNACQDSKTPILKYYSNEPSADLHKLMVQFVTGNFALEVDNFLNFCQQTVTDQMCSDTFEKTMQASQVELWQELRYGRITSSTLYAASRSNQYGTLKDPIFGASDVFHARLMKREKELKEYVLKAVAILRKIEILYPGGIQLHPEYPIFGATPDGTSEEYCILVKCPLKKSQMKKYIVGMKIKEKFYCQIMLQMHLCKKQKGLFCVAEPDFEKTRTVHVIDVIYDGNYLMEKIEGASRFWKENIFPILLKSCQN